MSTIYSSRNLDMTILSVGRTLGVRDRPTQVRIGITPYFCWNTRSKASGVMTAAEGESLRDNLTSPSALIVLRNSPMNWPVESHFDGLGRVTEWKHLLGCRDQQQKLLRCESYCSKQTSRALVEWAMWLVRQERTLLETLHLGDGS